MSRHKAALRAVLAMMLLGVISNPHAVATAQSARTPASSGPALPPRPEHGTWEWLHENFTLGLVVDPSAWHRIVGPAMLDPEERPTLGEIIDRYRRRMVEAVDAFESSVLPDGDSAARRYYWLHLDRDHTPTRARVRDALTRLHRAELAALEALSTETIAHRREREATTGRSIAWGAAMRDGGGALADDDTLLGRRVRSELIIGARLRQLERISTQSFGSVGEKRDIIVDLDAFIDGHGATLTSRDADGQWIDPPSTESILAAMGPFRDALAAHHLAWRDAADDRARAAWCDRTDGDAAERRRRRAVIAIGELHERVAPQIATRLADHGDGDVAAALWMHEWRCRAFKYQVVPSDLFETAIAWIEMLGDSSADRSAAIRAMRRDHRLARRSLEDAIAAAHLDRLRCLVDFRADPDACDESRLTEARARLDEMARRRVPAVRSMLVSPELVRAFDRAFPH